MKSQRAEKSLLRVGRVVSLLVLEVIRISRRISELLMGLGINA